MKKLVLTLGLLAGMSVQGWCVQTVGERFASLFGQFTKEASFKVGESIVPIYFYGISTGDQRAGAVSSFFKYGFLSADAGYLTADLSEAASKTGSPLLGGSIHLDEVANALIPELGAWLTGAVPGTAKNLLYRIQLGYGFVHDFELERFVNGFYIGPELRF